MRPSAYAQLRPTSTSVQDKPKKWSIGLFFAAGVWILGEAVFSWGGSWIWLVTCIVVSFVVDGLFTGSSLRRGVYID